MIPRDRIDPMIKNLKSKPDSNNEAENIAKVNVLSKLTRQKLFYDSIETMKYYDDKYERDNEDSAFKVWIKDFTEWQHNLGPMDDGIMPGFGADNWIEISLKK